MNCSYRKTKGENVSIKPFRTFLMEVVQFHKVAVTNLSKAQILCILLYSKA